MIDAHGFNRSPDGDGRVVSDERVGQVVFVGVVAVVT